MGNAEYLVLHGEYVNRQARRPEATLKQDVADVQPFQQLVNATFQRPRTLVAEGKGSNVPTGFSVVRVTKCMHDQHFKKYSLHKGALKFHMDDFRTSQEHRTEYGVAKEAFE